MAASDALTFDTPSADTAAGDPVLWTMYTESMPSEEREPPAVILASVAAGNAILTRARLAAATVGFAVTHLLERPPVAFLVYLAVATQHRGGGIGSQLFEYAWSTAERAAAGRELDLLGMTWEIDDPELAPEGPERQRRLQRRRFFERLGGEPLRVTYLQPPVNGPAVPMLLLWRGKSGRARPKVAELVRAIYFEKYGAANRIPSVTLDGLLKRVFVT
jgi:GNAT superfamily N-acetyltransferase